ncbi:MAG: AI-2E family transporter [Chloroflexota bacterium]|jgi:predicted PurR-regulated permease PerM
MKRLAGYTIVVLATIALLVVLWQFRSIIILLLISLALAAALRPGVKWLADKGLRLGFARALMYLLLIGGFGLLFYLIGRYVLDELQVLTNYLVIFYESFHRRLETGSAFQQSIAEFLPLPDALPAVLSGQNNSSVIQFLVGVTQSAISVLGGVVITLALSFYWSGDRNHFERLWLSALAAPQRIEARSIWRGTESAMGAYMRSELIQMFLAALLLGLGYVALGLTYPVLGALLGAVAWLIPLVGFLLIAAFSFLLGLTSSGSWILGLVALGYSVLVMLFLEFVVEPRLFQRRRFSGLLIIFIMILLVQAYGLVGFIFAPPLAVALQVLIGNIVRAMQRPQDLTYQIEGLEERLSMLQATMDEVDDEESNKEMKSLMGRLERLVERARSEVRYLD